MPLAGGIRLPPRHRSVYVLPMAANAPTFADWTVAAIYAFMGVLLLGLHAWKRGKTE